LDGIWKEANMAHFKVLRERLRKTRKEPQVRAASLQTEIRIQNFLNMKE
jgi:hypothetical protein